MSTETTTPEELPTAPMVRLGDGMFIWWEHDCITPTLDGGLRHSVRLPLNERTGWWVATPDPLTVTPSILCHSCKVHGFMTEGKWVSA